MIEKKKLNKVKIAKFIRYKGSTSSKPADSPAAA